MLCRDGLRHGGPWPRRLAIEPAVGPAKAQFCHNSTMKLFLSWSGVRSRRVAERLHGWLVDVMPVVIEPWMSEADIAAGKRWGREIDAQLAESAFGIVCLTGSNQAAPWLIFEAGALAKSVSEANVCPYLIDLEPQDLKPGPLTQFQAKRADENGTWDLVRAINSALGNSGFEESWLRKHFERWWPDLESELLRRSDEVGHVPKQRSSDEMLIEVLEIVRRIDTIEMPAGGWSSLFDEIGKLRDAVATVRQRPSVEPRAGARHRQIRLTVEYQRASGGLASMPVSVDSEDTVFGALTNIWSRLRSGDAAVQPEAFTYLWDWILIRKDGIPLLAGGLVYDLPSRVVFDSERVWSVERLEQPLLNDADWLNVIRGMPQV